MKIKNVHANNRKKAFELDVDGRHLVLPYARLRLKPDADNRVADVRVDPELGNEAFTYTLENGDEDSIHRDEVLEYNKDPNYLRDMLLYKLTVEARKSLKAGNLSHREILRRMGTSASQLYRLLDPTNYRKSIDQMLSLLTVLNCEVDLVVKRDKPERRQSRKSATSQAKDHLVRT